MISEWMFLIHDVCAFSRVSFGVKGAELVDISYQIYSCYSICLFSCGFYITYFITKIF